VRLRCPNCDAEVQADAIDIDLLVATCGACGMSFDFGDQFAAESGTRNSVRQAVPRPTNIRIEQSGSEIIFRRRWLTPAVFVLALIAGIWNGLMVLWFGVTLVTGTGSIGTVGGAYIMIGLFLAYITLAGFLNSTVIQVGRGSLQVRHIPLPWFGNRRLETVDIEQIYCKAIPHHRRSGVHFTHEVHVARRKGDPVKLLIGLPDAAQALFLEQEIEHYLGIPDRPVRGELPR
jgi:hypothetical protein